MSEITAPCDASHLLVAFEQNEFDIAGLADIDADQACVDECLRQLYRICKQRREPNAANRKLLAQVLFGMLYVGRTEYAADGLLKYWPYLFRRIREAVFSDPERFENEVSPTPQQQDLLGRWFLTALETFGYSAPDEGQTYVGPIIFHVGIPKSSLSRVISVIALACDEHGAGAISLPADVRSGCVTNRFLHRNVERLLSSNLQGAAQLWSCLARVVLAWQTQGDCSDELQQLPLALDPDEVRAALPLEPNTTRAPRRAFPQLRYDPQTGEIRLTFPGDTSADWTVLSGGQSIDLSWCRTHLGKTAEFSGPLPEEIVVAPIESNSGIRRIFTPSPKKWPGYWFHAHNGNLEDGTVINASGLNPGRWYAVLKGTPSQCSVPTIAQVQLKWSWFKGNEGWTAWEVEVPPRTNSQTHLEWCIGGELRRIPLTRRPGPRVEFLNSSIAKAATSDGNQVDVYAGAPTVVLRRQLPLTVQLLRESTESVAVVARLDLNPETATLLPAAQAGIYQLRESRGVGRTLLRFAIIPGLTIQEPEYDSGKLNATVRISADDSAGLISEAASSTLTDGTRSWNIRSTTVEPFVRAQWCWTSTDIPNLTFSWPLEALRWRITHAGDEYARWTRSPLHISPRTVEECDAQLDIQVPTGSGLLVNGKPYTGKFQASPSGSTCVLSVLPYRETIELENEGQRHAAVFKSERPLIDSLQGDSDTESLIVTWQSTTIQAGIVVVAWDPCDVLSSPKVFTLSTSEMESREWMTECDALPGKGWTSISLARSAGGIFRSVLHLAARRSETLEPVSLLLNRSTGQVTLSASSPASWPEFLHHISSSRLVHSPLECETITTFLSQLASIDEFDLVSAIRLLTDLDKLLAEPSTNDRDRKWAQTIHLAVLAQVRVVCRGNPNLGLSEDPVPEVFTSLLQLGIPAGWSYPSRCIAGNMPPLASSAYPLTYICDLWLLANSRVSLESDLKKAGSKVALPQKFEELQVQAARRVLQFHKTHALPPILTFLPRSQQSVMTSTTTRGHHHTFSLPPCALLESADDLCEALGLHDFALDCEAACEDHFSNRSRHLRQAATHGHYRRPLAPKRYSLYWCASCNKWQIDRLTPSPSFCCYTPEEHLHTAPISPQELADKHIRDTLHHWTVGTHLDADDCNAFDFLNRYREKLTSDTGGGLLNRELFKLSESTCMNLFGSQVQVTARKGLSPLAMIVWQIAWIDRISAWKGERTFLESSDHAQWEFSRALADALTAWPQLMERTIALAELVYWTLYRGGLGAAIKFRSDYTITSPANNTSTSPSASNTHATMMELRRQKPR